MEQNQMPLYNNQLELQNT